MDDLNEWLENLVVESGLIDFFADGIESTEVGKTMSRQECEAMAMGYLMGMNHALKSADVRANVSIRKPEITA